jgi:hypothetical protein
MTEENRRYVAERIAKDSAKDHMNAITSSPLREATSAPDTANTTPQGFEEVNQTEQTRRIDDWAYIPVSTLQNEIRHTD